MVGIGVKGNHVIQRDISYAYSAQTKTGQDIIKLIENATGRIELIKRAGGYNDVISKEKLNITSTLLHWSKSLKLPQKLTADAELQFKNYMKALESPTFLICKMESFGLNFARH